MPSIFVLNLDVTNVHAVKHSSRFLGLLSAVAGLGKTGQEGELL